MLKRMRRLAFAVAAATAIFVIPTSAFSQSFEIGPGGVRIGRGGQCEELRRACENKDRLGEQLPEASPTRCLRRIARSLPQQGSVRRTRRRELS